MQENPLGLRGIDFVEFASPEPAKLAQLFRAFGFSRLARHDGARTDLYRQNDITFLLNDGEGSFARRFAGLHGPSICSMGWRVDDARAAYAEALRRGAKAAELSDLGSSADKVPAIYGIGDSLIYFIDDWRDAARYARLGFRDLEHPERVPDKGFVAIDHLTNNVAKGTMQAWSDFYKRIFGFTEVRYFDIRGAKTGLTSFALRSPDGSFCIPINEGTEAKSQINEYLEEYRGPGIQHLAFLTKDILRSLASLEGTPIEMLTIDDEYYESIFARFPQLVAKREEIRRRNVLIDGDDEGYLLQIFTKNLIGPIFIEIIQRENHFSFGEGNFGALFRSIERDQQQRGYL